MNNIITSEQPERSNSELQKAKMDFVNEMGLQEYLNSYECHLNSQPLTYSEIQKEMNDVRWNTITEMQANYKYN